MAISERKYKAFRKEILKIAAQEISEPVVKYPQIICSLPLSSDVENDIDDFEIFGGKKSNIPQILKTRLLTCNLNSGYKNTAENSDKVYLVNLVFDGKEPYIEYKYGRRGGTLQEGRKPSFGFNDAYMVFDNLVNSKIKKGYKIIPNKDC
jgi:predicted DNA-binding WGR domain protein